MDKTQAIKPSDIILANIMRKGGSKDDAISAIIKYLDEQHDLIRDNR